MNTWLITSRELRSFFTTWMGYIIVFASLVINGILFNTYAIGSEPKYSSDVLYDFFYFSSGITMVACVFLAMWLLAEEKVNGTIVLFYTSPMTERQLIYGKFLSAVIFFLILQALSLYLPCLILLEGKISLGHLASGYIGTTLLGLAVLSISLFASVVSVNQLVAGIVAASITVILLVMWTLAAIVDNPLRDIFSYFALHNKHFASFGRGILHTKDVIYYLSVVFFFLECSIRALQYKRMEG